MSNTRKSSRKRNANHPRKGSSIKVEPIRSLEAIAMIKANLADKPRDLCLFTLGINTAYRAKELLSLTVGKVAHLESGDLLDIKQSKSRTYRATTLNNNAIAALQAWLAAHPDPLNHKPLFQSQSSGRALTVSAVSGMVKGWCADAGLRGNYASHSMRKTWGYQLRVQKNAQIPVLMTAFGHKTQAQTLEYLCIQDEEVRELFGLEL